MATATAACAASPVAKKRDPDARRHLQRLVRKVKHVLIVKRCIDDLKNGGARRRGGEQKTQNILDELPNGPEILPDLSADPDGAVNVLESTLEKTPSTLPPHAVPPESILKQLPAVQETTGALNSIETLLDSYISVTYDAVRKCKQRVMDSSQEFWTGWKWSRDSPVRSSFWISWAKKRVDSIRDNRALALINVSDEVDGHLGLLGIVQEYLEAYRKGSYGRQAERLSEVIARLSAVFGVGWFFEWPSGQHPLNSTWPWADVKPSLLVLWGVCWMFFPTQAFYGQHARPGHPMGPSRSIPYNEIYSIYGYPSQPTRPQTSASNQPLSMANMGFDATTSWIPGNNAAANTAQSIPGRHQATRTEEYVHPPQDMIGLHFHRSPAFPGDNSSHSRILPNDSYTSSNRVGPQGSWNASPLGLSNGRVAPQFIHRHSDVSHPVVPVQPTRPVAELPAQPPWRNSSDHLTQPRAPDHLGENPFIQAANPLRFTARSLIHNPQVSLPQLPPPTSASMPSSSFSNYPPLDQMTDLHNPQPYLVGQERAYQDMPEYEQHHDPPDQQQRYPTPPPPLTDPYHNQQGIDGAADGRMDMPMDHKSDSDAQSPGRSKPVPKPDREVTKDANGRFYCNWQGCTEDVKNFGRKCEWSKHMDKHDRPYKCPADGCEKLPGFTYSGGLLRHEREVHNKHGGPRKQLNCPHPNCKRHTGKGFSRQENLNEHLRRVHTDGGIPLPAEDTEDEANEQLGVKRKRARDDSANIHEEMKRLKAENAELKRQAETQTAQSAEMMRQIIQLQQAQQIMQHPRMQAPPAQMT